MKPEYKFTKKQVEAYNELIAACKKCKRVGLTLLSKQYDLNAYPTKFFRQGMVQPLFKTFGCTKPVPYLYGAHVDDSGADDVEYFKEEVQP